MKVPFLARISHSSDTMFSELGRFITVIDLFGNVLLLLCYLALYCIAFVLHVHMEMFLLMFLQFRSNRKPP